MFVYIADNSKGGGARVGDSTYKRISVRGGGVSQIGRGAKWQ